VYEKRPVGEMLAGTVAEDKENVTSEGPLVVTWYVQARFSNARVVGGTEVIVSGEAAAGKIAIPLITGSP
jgi:hypothetical protein